VRIDATEIDGVRVVGTEPVHDERGYFVRTFSADEFAEAGIDPTILQTSVSHNTEAGTLRGMHLQREPHGETKLVRCSAGRIFDVAVDVRPGSATFGRWFGLELDARSYTALLIPPGVAHGFITLEARSEITYAMSAFHVPAVSAGFRWDDPDVGIEWPRSPTVMSQRDRELPLLGDIVPGFEPPER
jgi:dTDP-4-dehydrorhamnose 3,5-epimerase